MHDTGKPGRPQDRRGFFRKSLVQLLRPLAGYVEQRVTLPDVRYVLRPPGALSETPFLERCMRCGNCADVCPADAIKLCPTEDGQRSGTPVIDANLAACVVCDDIACTKACPSGALRELHSAASIRMGLALVDEDVCVRSKGEDCRECVDKCPIGSSAITLDKKGRVEVFADGCVGCGVCQLYCPTQPKAIVVDPI